MKRIITITSIFALLFSSLSAQNYNKEFIKQVKKILGNDYREYSFLSYPLDNFGALTFYKDAASDENQICAAATCLGLPTPAANSTDWINMFDYLDIGGGGQITLTEKSQKQIVIKTILPKIYQVLNISGQYDRKRVVNATININQGFKRILKLEKVNNFINSLNNTSLLKKSYVNNNLVYVYADFVIDKMSVSIDVDINAATEIDTKLNLSVNPGAIFSTDSNTGLSLSITKVSNGSYKINFDKPVIIARLIKFQPSEGGLGSNVNNTITKDIKDPSLIN